MATYFGYDNHGQPEWLQFHGKLIRSTESGVTWELDSEMRWYEGGNCPTCEYQKPTRLEDGIPVSLRFTQRNHLAILLGNSPAQNFVPQTFGSVSRAYLPKVSEYRFPEYNEPDNSDWEKIAKFVIITKPNSDPPRLWDWQSIIVTIWGGKTPVNGPNAGKLVYNAVVNLAPPEVYPYANIICDPKKVDSEPGCVFEVIGPPRIKFYMPYGNLGDARFFGEAEDGSTIEAFRLFYD